MDIFQAAKTELEHAEYVKVFAPSGMWAFGEEKTEWLKALADREDLKRLFVSGGAPSKELEGIVDERIGVLESGGVEVCLFDPIKDFRLGTIVFGNSVIIGFPSVNGEDLRWEISNEKHIIELFEWVTENAKEACT